MDEHRARALLAEISSERLDQFLLANYRTALTESAHYLGIAPLDRLIHHFLQIPQSQPQQQPPQQQGSINARFPLIEVAGVGPCSGKTQLLYHVVAGLLVGANGHERSDRSDVDQAGRAHQREREIEDSDQEEDSEEDRDQAEHYQEEENERSSNRDVGHRPSIVVWLDCSGRFDIQRLADIVADVQSAIASDTADARDCSEKASPFHSPATFEALRALLVDRPASFDALLRAIESLPDQLLDDAELPATHPGLSKKAVAAVVVSSVDTFLPIERAAAAAAVAVKTAKNSTTTADTAHDQDEDIARRDREAAGQSATSAPSSTYAHHAHPQPAGTSNTTHPSTPYAKLDARYGQLITALRRMQARLGCVVVAGRRASGTAHASAHGALPGAWLRAVDAWVRVERREHRTMVPADANVLEMLKNMEVQETETRFFDVSVAGRGRARADGRVRLAINAQGVHVEEVDPIEAGEAETEREHADG